MTNTLTFQKLSVCSSLSHNFPNLIIKVVTNIIHLFVCLHLALKVTKQLCTSLKNRNYQTHE